VQHYNELADWKEAHEAGKGMMDGPADLLPWATRKRKTTTGPTDGGRQELLRVLRERTQVAGRVRSEEERKQFKEDGSTRRGPL